MAEYQDISKNKAVNGCNSSNGRSWCVPSRNSVEDLAWLVDYREGGSRLKVSLTRELGGLQWFTKECGLGIDVCSVDSWTSG